MKQLHGGPFNGETVSNAREDDLWVVVHSINGKRWTPPAGVFYAAFPANVMRHGYRKQKNGQFQFAWTRPNQD